MNTVITFNTTTGKYHAFEGNRFIGAYETMLEAGQKLIKPGSKPKIPMIPKYYYVVNTDCHPTRLAEFCTYKYFGQISSWHRTLAAATKAEKRLHRYRVYTTAIYGADFVIRDSDFLAECYGGAAPFWRTPVLIEEAK